MERIFRRKREESAGEGRRRREQVREGGDDGSRQGGTHMQTSLPDNSLRRKRWTTSHVRTGQWMMECGRWCQLSLQHSREDAWRGTGGWKGGRTRHSRQLPLHHNSHDYDQFGSNIATQLPIFWHGRGLENNCIQLQIGVEVTPRFSNKSYVRLHRWKTCPIRPT